VLEVEVLEDPLEERQRGLHLDRRRQQPADREEQTRLQRGERDDRAGRKVRRAGDQVDERRRDGEEGRDEREERASDHLLPHLQAR
jgi:hypothetical protein